MVQRIDSDGYIYTKVVLEPIYNNTNKNVNAELANNIKERELEEIRQKNTSNLEELEKGLIEEPIDAIKNMNVKRLYDIDKELNWVIISVLRPDTYEMVRQIPPEANINIARYLNKYNNIDNNINILV